MTAVVLTSLGNGVSGAVGTGSPGLAAGSSVVPVTPTHGAGAEQRFAQALQSASPGAAADASAAAPNASVAQSGAAAEASQDAQERARRALKLDAPVSAAKKTEAGDLVLDGLQKLRGTFNAHEGRIADLMSKKEPDLNALLAMQMEVVNFTVLVDVTAKLTGQSTQAFETLLKGQ
jgi:type III secretion system YscI/HrpB-like protein